jgi:DNA primase
MVLLASTIPEEKISEIKHAADIVDVVSESVMLKKAGKNYLGLCPFHSEKTPSFTVSPDKQIFYCFGCGTGGNIFSFLMKHQGLGFPEAVRSLARRYGIDIPDRQMTPDQRRRMTEREHLLAANREAMAFYRQNLDQGAPGQAARDYLDRRGITKEVIEKFGLGYALPGWDNLLRHMDRRRIPPGLGEKAGLVIPRKDRHGHYDRFRDRIVFPIRDAHGRVVGFGGRVMGDELPKYLNSPETPVYNKRRILYGLDLARQKCRESRTVFIVEGYLDAIALSQYGFENAVATLGTALTAEHVHLIKGHAERVILVFDSDTAGVKAAQRSIPIFVEAGVEASILVLPRGDDPDTYLRRFGAEAFGTLVEKALGIIPFLLESAIVRHGTSVEGKIRIVGDMMASLATVNDGMARALHVRDMADRLGIDESALLERLREHTGQKLRQQGTAAPPPPGGAALQGGGQGLERQLVAMMFQYPKILPEVAARGLVEQFQDPALKAIGEKILALPDEPGGDAADIVQGIEDERLKGLAASLAIGQAPWDDRGCRRIMTQYEGCRSRRRNDLVQQIRAAEANNDQALLLKLLQDKQLQARNRQELT